MPITVACRCGQRFAARDNLAGRQVKCPSCGGPISIPAPPQADPLAPLDGGIDLGSVASAEQSAHTTSQPLGAGGHAQSSGGGGFFDEKTLIIAAASIGGVVVLVLMALIVFSGGGDDDEPVATSDPPPPEVVDEPIVTSSNQQPLTPTFTAPVTNENLPIVDPEPGGFGSGPDPYGPAVVQPPETEVPEVYRNSPPPPNSAQPNNSQFGSSDNGSSSNASPQQAADSSVIHPGLPRGLNAWRNGANTTLLGVKRAGEAPSIVAHYSWMAQILPHLGHQDVYDEFDMNKPWIEGVNQQPCLYVIPEFINPANDHTRWKGYPYPEIALTHFVGVAGVEDTRNTLAAELPRSSPSAGVFGYQEIASGKQIKDGQSNTLAIIGAGEITGPWVQAGGATIRGAREPFFADITGFGSKGVDPRGAIGTMADGSVRIISADIDPKVFRAMCTINGAESVDILGNPSVKNPK